MLYEERRERVEREGVINQSGLAYPAVYHPAVSLHEHGRSKVLLRVPPIGGARRAATETQDTLIETILSVCVWERRGEGSERERRRGGEDCD